MNIAQTNAAAFIGHINPGVGYWWSVTNHGLMLWLPKTGLHETWGVFVGRGVWVGLVLVLFLELAWRYGRKGKSPAGAHRVCGQSWLQRIRSKCSNWNKTENRGRKHSNTASIEK